MQRKTRNAFIIGMLITMVVAAIPIVLMVLKIKGYKDAEKAADAAMVSIYVLNDDIKSGDEISANNCSVLRVNRNLIPENAIANQTDIESLLNPEKPSMAKVDLKKNTVITENYIAGIYRAQKGIPLKLFNPSRLGLSDQNYTLEEIGTNNTRRLQEFNITDGVITPEITGTIQIKLIFKVSLTSLDFMFEGCSSLIKLSLIF